MGEEPGAAFPLDEEAGEPLPLDEGLGAFELGEGADPPFPPGAAGGGFVAGGLGAGSPTSTKASESSGASVVTNCFTI